MARGFSGRSGSQNQSARFSGQDAQFTQSSGKGQPQSEPSQVGPFRKNRKKFWGKSGQDSGNSGKKGDNQNRGQKSQQDRPPQFSQQNSSRGSAPYPSATQSGRGTRPNLFGNCYTCGQPGHKSYDCSIKPSTGPGKGAARSEPTVGDAGRNHRVFAAVDNRQAEHQGTVVEATGTLHGISTLVLFDSGASDSFISPSLVQRCGLVAMC